MTTNNHNKPLFESLEFKDLDGLMKPTIHVDEFSSKMGDDDDIIVVSFFVRDEQAAKDLMSWFEKGYDFVLDADRSPGEIKPNRYLVYVEMRRRSTAGANVETLLHDLNTLTEFDVEDWTMHYQGKDIPFSRDTFDSAVPLTPRAYRERYEKDLNEMRAQAGLPAKPIYDKKDKTLQQIQSAAGIL
ncbi:hypothetical protein UFOVP328_63 [uncultured Caudovirales phage]|uniref:Uncharacterized protein n=1 Tax=uncultured Caudovirales phage TaxID=2100421 RepID=A0A6J5LT42_9CAUD|nr:hypothetical protein UFOVP328_63 [uncultured Caudovirales phage]